MRLVLRPVVTTVYGLPKHFCTSLLYEFLYEPTYIYTRINVMCVFVCVCVYVYSYFILFNAEILLQFY